jgi:hypothetical protein
MQSQAFTLAIIRTSQDTQQFAGVLLPQAMQNILRVQVPAIIKKRVTACFEASSYST